MAVYEVKFRLDYCNSVGQNARLDIELKNYTGSTIFPIEGTAMPFIQNIKSDSNDKSSYFKTRTAELNIYENENFKLDDLLTSDETEIRVKYYIDSNIDFIGFVIPDFFDVSMDNNPVISMTASDRIATLKSQTLEIGSGLESFQVLLIQCLAKTGLDLPLNSTINFNVVGETGDFLTKTAIQKERLSDDRNGFVSCYDIIKSILITANALLVQSSGQWHIINKYELEQFTANKQIEIINVGGRRTINPPRMSVGVMMEFGGSRTYPNNHNFEQFNGISFVDWVSVKNFNVAQNNREIIEYVGETGDTYKTVTYGDEVDQKSLINAVTNVFFHTQNWTENAYLKSAPTKVFSGNQNAVEVRISLNATGRNHTTQKFQVIAEKGTEIKTLNSETRRFEDVSPSNTRSNRYTQEVNFTDIEESYFVPFTRNKDVSGILEADYLVNWTVSIRIFGVGDYSPIFINSATIEFKEIGEQPQGNLFKTTQGVNFTKEAEIDTTIFGDFIKEGVNGYFYDYPIDETSSIFYNRDIGSFENRGLGWTAPSTAETPYFAEPQPLLLHSVRQRARMFSAPHNIITATVRGQFNALDVYSVCDKKHVLIEAEYDFLRNETNLVIEEVKYAQVEKTDFIYSYFGGEDTTSVKGISSVSSSGSSVGGNNYIQYDVENDAYFSDKPFYSTGEISAYGIGEIGGGTGEITIDIIDGFAENSNFSNKAASSRNTYLLNQRVQVLEQAGQGVSSWNDLSDIPSNLTNIDSLLSGKVNNSRVLTDVPTNAIFTDTIVDISGKENLFSKNTAFNKNFGSGYSDVTRGNHNHDLAYKAVGYVPTWNEIISKPTTFTPSSHVHTKAQITDFAHIHVISDITNLQTALDAKLNTVLFTGHTHTFASLTGKPTTLSGYGVTDAATKTELTAHENKTDNPHLVTKAQVGLENVDNESKTTMFNNPIFTVAITTPEIKIGANWTVSEVGTELLFKRSGVIKNRMLADGSFVAVGEITAYS